jgi:hypothetical protein
MDTPEDAPEPLVIDSGPVTLQATTGSSNDQEVRDGGDRPSAGE